MLKKLLILPVVFFCVFLMTGSAWSAVLGSWAMSGKVTINVKGKGIQPPTIHGALDGDIWTFNEDASFESTYVGGAWSQNKSKFYVNFDDDDVISLVETILTEEYGTAVTVTGIIKETFNGTENAKKQTIKGNFKIIMTGTGYDASCDCDRTGKITVTGNFSGVPGEPAAGSISNGTFQGENPEIEFDVSNHAVTRIKVTFRDANSFPPGCMSDNYETAIPAGLAPIEDGMFAVSLSDVDGLVIVSGAFTDNNTAGGAWSVTAPGCTNNDSWTATRQ